MKHTIKFSIQGHPKTKGSTRSFVHPRTGRVITMNDNKKEKPWSTAVALYAQCYAPKDAPWSGAVELNLTFRLPKPKYLRNKPEAFHIKKPDKDKLERSVMDALTGVFYKDDSQVVGGHIWKQYDDKPGVDIEIINLEKLAESSKGGK